MVLAQYLPICPKTIARIEGTIMRNKGRSTNNQDTPSTWVKEKKAVGAMHEKKSAKMLMKPKERLAMAIQFHFFV